jgi:hypothetical protein
MHKKNDSLTTPKPWQMAIISLALAIFTFAIFSPALRNGFVNWDDNFYVTGNPHVNSGLTWEGLRWALTIDPIQWHPLTWLSLQLDWQVFRGEAWGFHFVNILFHVANSVILLLILHSFTGRLWPSVLTALFFAVHPLQVQSVAWITERKNVLATFFWLLTMASYLRYIHRPSVIRYAFVFMAMGLGLLAKSTVVALPLVLLLLDFWPLNRCPFLIRIIDAAQPGKSEWQVDVRWPVIIEKLPLIVLAIVASYLTYENRELHRFVVSTDKLPMSYRMGYSMIYYCQYLSKVFWPVDLSCFYPHERTVPPSWQVLGALNLLALVTSVAIWQSPRRPYLLVGWLWFMVTLAPTIGIVQVGEQSIADHFIYIPVIGVFIMLAWFACELATWQRVIKLLLVPALAVAAIACAVLSNRQTRIWHDSISLWQQAARVTDYNYYVCPFLSQAYLDRKMIREALEVYEQGMTRSPNNPMLRIWHAELLNRVNEIAPADVQHSDGPTQITP